MFYLPCRAAVGDEASFFLNFAGEQRSSLNVEAAINRPITADREVEVERAQPAARQAVQPQPIIVLSPSMQAMREELMDGEQERADARRQEKVERAIDEWRSCLPGEGSKAFFKLGMALKRAEMENYEIGSTLRLEAAHSRSPAGRRAQGSIHLAKGIIDRNRRSCSGREARSRAAVHRGPTNRPSSRPTSSPL